MSDTEIRTIICKGRYETLICPQSHQIEVIKAAYGYFRNNANFVNQVKNLCNLGRAGSNNCAAASSMKTVTSSCTGKQQCTLYAHDSVFSDKCSRWVYSVLDVTYKCVYKGKAGYAIAIVLSSCLEMNRITRISQIIHLCLAYLALILCFSIASEMDSCKTKYFHPHWLHKVCHL